MCPKNNTPYAPRISDKVLKKAKEMFMNYRRQSYIAATLNLHRASLNYHCKKWKKERDLLKAELFSSLSEGKRVQFTTMTEATMQVMQRALTELATRKEPPTITEATKAAEIMSTLDKITRLDDGNPTDIISNQEKPLTVETVRRKLLLDPFSERDAEVEEVEYEEQDDEKRDEESN